MITRFYAELKLCPFCGNVPLRSVTSVFMTGEESVYADCRTKGCPLSGKNIKAEDWNRRSNAEVIAALERVIKRKDDYYYRGVNATGSYSSGWNDALDTMKIDIDAELAALRGGKEGK